MKFLPFVSLPGVLAAGLLAQSLSTSPVRVWNSYAASAFGAWSLPSQTATPSPGTYVLKFGASVTVVGGPEIHPLATNAPLVIDSGAQQEIATPSAVACASAVCAVTLTLAKAHPSHFSVSSATGGLQEVINFLQQSGGTVVLDSGWTGATSAILSASGASGVAILDQRTSPWSWFEWNGGAYQASPVADVRAFGAKCDGSTDDHLALQAALNATAALRTPLRIPPGVTCLSGAPLTFTTGTKLISIGRHDGGGILHFAFIPPAGQPTYLLAPAPDANASSFNLDGVVLDYRDVVPDPTASVTALYLHAGEDASVSNSTFLGPATGAWGKGAVRGVLVDMNASPEQRADYAEIKSNEFVGDTQDVAVLGGNPGEDSVNAGIVADNLFLSAVPLNQPQVDGLTVGANLRLANSYGFAVYGNRFTNPGFNVSLEPGAAGVMFSSNYFDFDSAATWMTIDPADGAHAVFLFANRNLTAGVIAASVPLAWSGSLSDGVTRSADLYLQSSSTADASHNFAGPAAHFTAPVWHAGAAATDDCQLDNQPLSASGADPNMSLTLACTGSAGTHILDLTSLANVKLPALQSPALVSPSIGGEPVSASPRSFLDAFAAGPLIASLVFAQVTLDKAMTLTRIQATAATAPSGCATNAVVRVYPDGNPGAGMSLTIAAANNDSGTTAAAWSAGTVLDFAIYAAATGCAATPANLNLITQWRTN